MKMKIKSAVGIYLLISPFLVLFFMFCILPFFITFIAAFSCLDSLMRLGEHGDVFIRILQSFIITGVGGFALSVLAAWLISFLPFFSRLFFMFTLFAPMFYMQFELLLFGFGFLAVAAGMGTVPKERYETARLEGMSNSLAVLIRITLPAIKPQLLFAAVTQAALAFSHGFTLEHSFDSGSISALCAVIFSMMLLLYTGIKIAFGRWNAESD